MNFRWMHVLVIVTQMMSVLIISYVFNVMQMMLCLAALEELSMNSVQIFASSVLPTIYGSLETMEFLKVLFHWENARETVTLTLSKFYAAFYLLCVSFGLSLLCTLFQRIRILTSFDSFFDCINKDAPLD